MTRFADDLFDDLMREHGSALTGMTAPAAPKRRLARRPVLLTAGAGGLAAAAAIGTLAVGGGTPAYAVTTHPDGTVTLAVYQQPGMAQANAKLHTLGERVVVLPVKAGCPSIDSLRPPRVPTDRISVKASGSVSTSGSASVTVNGQGVPAGDILVVGFATTTTGNGQNSGPGKVTSGGQVSAGGPGHAAAGSPAPGAVFSLGASKLTSGPVPSCVSVPAGRLPAGGNAGGSASCAHTPAPVGSVPPTVQATAQAGGRNPQPGWRVTGGCTSTGKAVGGVTPAGTGGTTHSSG